MAREIEVTIEGEITDFNIQLFNRQLAIILMKELGVEKCGMLLELIKQRQEEEAREKEKEKENNKE